MGSDNLEKPAGPDIWPLLIDRNPDLGGVICLNCGRLGSGKTSMLIEIARRLLDNKARLSKSAELGSMEELIANELLFWRGETSCQWRKLPNKYPVELWAIEGLNLKFYLNGKPINHPLKRFADFKELEERANPHALNVVHLPHPRDFRNLARFLVDQPAYLWSSLFMDEVEDVAASQESGADWRSIRDFTDAVKSARKRRVSLYLATQAISDIDFRLKQKIQYYFFMPGAPRIKGIRVWQRAIDSLSLGECYLASMGVFQLLRFPPYISYDDMVVEGLERASKPSEKAKTKKESGERGTSSELEV